MNAEERLQKIESYGNAHRLLVEILEQYPREMWNYRPSPHEWSLHEIVIHLADSETNGYVRCRRCIAEPGGVIMAYDPGAWAGALDYPNQSVEEALELFRLLRQKTYRLLKSLPAQAWSRTYQHPESGTLTLEDWLSVYAGHVPGHLEQMQAVYQAWSEQR